MTHQTYRVQGMAPTQVEYDEIEAETAEAAAEEMADRYGGSKTRYTAVPKVGGI